MPDDTTEGPTFSLFLENIQDGVFVADLHERLVELTTQMQKQESATGGKPKGKLTIAIDLVLDRGVFDVSADVAVKMPKTVRGRSIMYAQPQGGLSPLNPKQLELGIGAKDVTTAPSRAVALR